jgi:hypothetical protein
MITMHLSHAMSQKSIDYFCMSLDQPHDIRVRRRLFHLHAPFRLCNLHVNLIPAREYFGKKGIAPMDRTALLQPAVHRLDMFLQSGSHHGIVTFSHRFDPVWQRGHSATNLFPMRKQEVEIRSIRPMGGIATYASPTATVSTTLRPSLLRNCNWREYSSDDTRRRHQEADDVHSHTCPPVQICNDNFFHIGRPASPALLLRPFCPHVVPTMIRPSL